MLVSAVWKISAKLIIAKPLTTKSKRIITGTIKPRKIGMKQIRKQINFLEFDKFSEINIFCPLLNSWNLCLLLAKYSTVRRITTKINNTDDICEAPERLFIPSHTLKTPSVKVSKAKYSTVPKSEIVSINTNARPANIPGLAKGRATEKKLFRPYIRLV